MFRIFTRRPAVRPIRASFTPRLESLDERVTPSDFSGSIPTQLGQFTGSIPTQLGQFSGSIPTQLGN
jgi:hypothetical protein